MKLLIFGALLFMGCTRTVYVPMVSSRTVVDTLVMESRDSSMIRALFECDSSGRILMSELLQLKGKAAVQVIEFVDNELKVKTQWQTKVVERLVEVRDTATVVEMREVIRERAYVPKFFWGCFGVVLIVAGVLVFRFFRR